MTEKGLEEAIKAAARAMKLGCTVAIHGVPVGLRKPHWKFWNLANAKVATSTIVYDGQPVSIFFFMMGLSLLQNLTILLLSRCYDQVLDENPT